MKKYVSLLINQDKVANLKIIYVLHLKHIKINVIFKGQMQYHVIIILMEIVDGIVLH